MTFANPQLVGILTHLTGIRIAYSLAFSVVTGAEMRLLSTVL